MARLSKVVTGNTRENVIPFINENVDNSAMIMTDTSHLYTPLKAAYQHQTINHENFQYVDGLCHTNTVEGYFGLFKRMVYGIYHQVSTKHLQSYVDEHNFRYNSRKEKDGERFYNSLGNVEGRLTYKSLINRPIPEFIRPEINLIPTKQLPAKATNRGRKPKPVAIMKEGEILATYSSIAEASLTTGIPHSKIQRAAQKGNWSTYGYQWKYI